MQDNATTIEIRCTRENGWHCRAPWHGETRTVFRPDMGDDFRNLQACIEYARESEDA